MSWVMSYEMERAREYHIGAWSCLWVPNGGCFSALSALHTGAGRCHTTSGMHEGDHLVVYWLASGAWRSNISRSRSVN